MEEEEVYRAGNEEEEERGEGEEEEEGGKGHRHDRHCVEYSTGVGIVVVGDKKRAAKGQPRIGLK